MGFVCTESFIVPESTKPYVDWNHKPKRCFPSPSVSYKVLLEHHFQCFLPVHVTSCDWPQLEAVPGGLPAACSRGRCTMAVQGHGPASCDLWQGVGLVRPATLHLAPSPSLAPRTGGHCVCDSSLLCEFPLEPFYGSRGNTQMSHVREIGSHIAQCTWRPSNTAWKKKAKALPSRPRRAIRALTQQQHTHT